MTIRISEHKSVGVTHASLHPPLHDVTAAEADRGKMLAQALQGRQHRNNYLASVGLPGAAHSEYTL